MANKKDLAEAQSYSRRRLVTAFSSGIPDGVELTPKKNQSPVIVGVGLTVIAILVSLFYGMVSPSLPDGWENNKLIVAKTQRHDMSVQMERCTPSSMPSAHDCSFRHPTSKCSR